MRPKICVVGSFVAGITIRVSRVPAPGESLIGDRFYLGPGGKGFNQAVAAARAGALVSIILCTGKDLFSAMAKKVLVEEGISIHLMTEMDSIHSGCGLVTLLHNGENTIILDPGANSCMSPDMVEEATNEIAGARVIMAQLEVPDPAVERAFSLGRKHGCITILNPAPARKVSARILLDADIITPNETESKILLGFSPDESIPVDQLSSELLKLGAKTIVMTRGRAGALIITSREMTEVKAPEVTPVDTTGAGDCFNGNLAYGLATGLSLIKSVERAVYAGAYSTRVLGVIDGLPSASVLNGFIRELEADSKMN